MYKYVGELRHYEDSKYHFVDIDYDIEDIRNKFGIDDEFPNYLIVIDNGEITELYGVNGITLDSGVYKYNLNSKGIVVPYDNDDESTDLGDLMWNNGSQLVVYNKSELYNKPEINITFTSNTTDISEQYLQEVQNVTLETKTDTVQQCLYGCNTKGTLCKSCENFFCAKHSVEHIENWSLYHAPEPEDIEFEIDDDDLDELMLYEYEDSEDY